MSLQSVRPVITVVHLHPDESAPESPHMLSFSVERVISLIFLYLLN